MTAYYNEHDAFAAQWLRNLIAAGHIAPGVVDERSIEDVAPDDLKDFTQCHFFAGIGGWSYALRLAGWPADRPVWTGSCPCQPLSSAGRRKGHADERHLWPAFFHLISECRPSTCFGEQVASKDGREWFAGVRADMEALGYACGGADLCAAGVGAPHIRQRLWWCAANGNSAGLSLGHVSREFGAEEITSAWREFKRVHAEGDWATREDRASIRAFVDGIPGRVGIVRGAGNAIVPQLAAEFIEASCEAILECT